MEIARFETFTMGLSFRDDDPNRTWATALGLDLMSEYPEEAVYVPWHDAGELILALQNAQRERARALAAAEADGTVAAVLLQGHRAAAPGDFG